MEKAACDPTRSPPLMWWRTAKMPASWRSNDGDRLVNCLGSPFNCNCFLGPMRRGARPHGPIDCGGRCAFGAEWPRPAGTVGRARARRPGRTTLNSPPYDVLRDVLRASIALQFRIMFPSRLVRPGVRRTDARPVCASTCARKYPRRALRSESPARASTARRRHPRAHERAGLGVGGGVPMCLLVADREAAAPLRPVAAPSNRLWMSVLAALVGLAALARSVKAEMTAGCRRASRVKQRLCAPPDRVTVVRIAG